jgi:hypothetical protein
MVEVPVEFVVAVEALSPADRTDLMRTLVSPRSDRLDRIRRPYERDETRQVTGLPIDFEADRIGPVAGERSVPQRSDSS